MTRKQFPFSALLGQEAMQTALLVNAVDPGIGGVLVRGQKGTGKSTAARALADLLPQIRTVAGCPYHCPPDQPDEMHDDCRTRHAAGEDLLFNTEATPFIDLPLSAGEDRLVGTLHLGKTLETGQRHFEPGLLASANRGILYVDEVNLLPDHLVDLLLDVSASGTNIVEREGLRVVHPARFILIGTMNPEEGELRPQFLDRFGLCVTVSGMTDADLRRNIVLRRLAFDQDPDAFCATWQDAEQALAVQIDKARQRLWQVTIPDQVLDRAVALASAARVQGHRADLALVRTARALAALLDRTSVSLHDLAEAARYVLPHRLGRQAGAISEEGSNLIEELLAEHLPFNPKHEASAPAVEEDLFYLDDSIEFPGSAAAGGSLFAHLKKKLKIASSPPKKPST
jgi:Mg-chelatase subunit ChlI